MMDTIVTIEPERKGAFIVITYTGELKDLEPVRCAVSEDELKQLQALLNEKWPTEQYVAGYRAGTMEAL